MEIGIVLFAIAAIVIFMLYRVFQQYLQNPILELKKDEAKDKAKKPSQNVEQKIILSPKDKLKSSEFGLIVRILSKLNTLENNNNIFSNKLIDRIIDTMREEVSYEKSLFLEIANEAKDENISDLAELFTISTKGEYKKRLKLIEMMYAVSYSDEKLGKIEEDSIKDVANRLKVDIEDFNKISQSFEKLYNNESEMTKTHALLVLNLEHDYTKEELNERYNALLLKNDHNITDYKNLEKDYVSASGEKMREINMAYNLLLKDAK